VRPFLFLLMLASLASAQQSAAPRLPAPVVLPAADAADAASMQAYVETIPGTSANYRMLPVPPGRFAMGSPDDERDRGSDEGPTREVELGAFWIGAHEVTWAEFNQFVHKLDLRDQAAGDAQRVPQDDFADAVSRPTPPYVPLDGGAASKDHPAVCMTQLAARQYTKWLSMKTGRFHRLPTEAEWEYACRAGTTTRWSFGDDVAQLDAHAWSYQNSDGRTHAVGTLRSNPWGLFDMHGNAAEWVLDRHDPEGYAALGIGPMANPVSWPQELYPRVVRGGSWDDDPEALRSAARRGSNEGWQRRDPQLPKSIWHHTDATFVGLRVVRPWAEPTAAEMTRAWEPDVEALAKIMKRQQAGER
jgi:formylglycine-generating enzyme required for sulfatase activity